jgi:hypothetical protein
MITPETVFKTICDMSYEQREEVLKMLVNKEPDLADGLLCSLGAKYSRYLAITRKELGLED